MLLVSYNNLLAGGEESVITYTVKLFKANVCFILIITYPETALLISVDGGT